MKKISFWIPMFFLITTSGSCNLSLIINSISKLNTAAFNHNWAITSKKHDAIENWISFPRNKWKVFITKPTWENKFLAWIGDALIGKSTTSFLKTQFYEEFKNWPKDGGGTFDREFYFGVADYTFHYMVEISNLLYSSERVYRIVFVTDGESTWEGIDIDQ